MQRTPKTPETSGHISTGSSESAALTQSLANRLQQQLNSIGSMEYRQTWKQKTTPLGRVYWEHTASVPPISDRDFSGWATPCARDYKDTVQVILRRGRCDQLPRQVVSSAAHSSAQQRSAQQLRTGQTTKSSTQTNTLSGVVSPELACWLMGFPDAWFHSEP